MENTDATIFQSVPQTPVLSSHEDSICWNCIHACPSKKTGCSWSRHFKPVPGSTYIPGGKLPLNQGRGLIILTCPQYSQLHKFTTAPQVSKHLMNHFSISKTKYAQSPIYWTKKYLKELKTNPELLPLPGWFIAYIDELERLQAEGKSGKRGREL